MNEIEHYLAQARPDYQEGVRLFERYGENQALLRTLQNGRPQNYRPYLLTELRKLLKKSSLPVPKPIAAKPFAPVSTVSKPLPFKDVKPAPYREVEQFRIARFNEMAQLRNNLADMASDADRALAVDKISKLRDLNQQLWAALDYFDQHQAWPEGKFPLDSFQVKKPDLSGQTEAQLHNRLKSQLRPKITRAEQRLEELKAQYGPEHSKTRKKEAELMEALLEHDSIAAKLNLKQKLS